MLQFLIHLVCHIEFVLKVCQAIGCFWNTAANIACFSIARTVMTVFGQSNSGQSIFGRCVLCLCVVCVCCVCCVCCVWLFSFLGVGAGYGFMMWVLVSRFSFAHFLVLRDRPSPGPYPGLQPRRLWGRRGFTRQPENSKRALFRVGALQTPPKFHEKTPKREREENEFCGGRKREILGLPTLRPLPFGAPPFRAPPSGPSPFGAPPFLGLGSHLSGRSRPPPFGAPPRGPPFGDPTILVLGSFFCPVCQFLFCPNVVFLSCLSFSILSQMSFFCPVCVFFVPDAIFFVPTTGCLFCPVSVFLSRGVFFCPNTHALVMGSGASALAKSSAARNRRWRVSLHLPSTLSTSRRCTPQVLGHFQMGYWPDTSQTRTNPNPWAWANTSGGISRTRS